MNNLPRGHTLRAGWIKVIKVVIQVLDDFRDFLSVSVQPQAFLAIDDPFG